MNSKRGRPSFPATQAKRENEKMWAENRPAYAVDISPSDMFKHLVNGEAFASVSKGLGLSHKSIPHALVVDMLKVMEGEAEEFSKKINACVAEKKAAIRSQTKAGGRKLPSKKMREAIDGNLAGCAALKEFFAGKVTYKVLHKLLEEMRLPVPDDRTLRRWKKLEIGH